MSSWHVDVVRAVVNRNEAKLGELLARTGDKLSEDDLAWAAKASHVAAHEGLTACLRQFATHLPEVFAVVCDGNTTALAAADNDQDECLVVVLEAVPDSLSPGKETDDPH